MPNCAPQMRVAFSSIFWNTGSSSPAELLMTLSTSDVAVCCSSDSASSRVRALTSSNSRTFSIAMTAWSANVVTSSICFSVKAWTARRVRAITPIGIPPAAGAHLASFDSRRCVLPRQLVFRIGQDVEDLDRSSFEQGPTDNRPATWLYPKASEIFHVFAYVCPRGQNLRQE